MFAKPVDVFARIAALLAAGQTNKETGTATSYATLSATTLLLSNQFAK